MDPALFRRVLGHLPTGVTVITAHHESGPVGMSSNSVTSVSLAPPLLLFCAALDSETWPKIRETGRFCVNVFASHHEDFARRFARRGVDRFELVAIHPRSAGPGLDDAVAWIDCEIAEIHPGGDHSIVVGAVVEVEARPDTDPLVFFRGVYGSFAPPGSRDN